MAVHLSDEILRSVERPSRYTGSEWNSVIKDPGSVDIRFAFCFPDTYEIGMSHLGMRILYHLLNEREDTYCERVFAPWTDMETKMRENGIPLFSLETKEAVGNFDFVGFTLQYEMSYTNIINMLDLAGIPLFSSQRTEDHPFVCAGGPCACNPEPLADIVDFFMLGEGEDIINEVMDIYREWKSNGASRDDFLNRVVKIDGIYVPEFYNTIYNDDGTVRDVSPVRSDYPSKIRKRIINDLDSTYFPEKIIVPYTGIVHDRIMLELFRGCTRGCRFCQAGFIYRPVRERSPGRLSCLAKKLEEGTGYEEISLVSLSTSDYTGLPELTQELVDSLESKRVSLSLPSLRIDSFSLALMEKASAVRKSGLTFAPEAGTQRLRDVINKGVTEEDLINSVQTAFKGGWSSIKLYFMLGLPTEEHDDLDGISDLAAKTINTYMKVPKNERGKGLRVTVSTASFVPKPFTPFQWESQDEALVLREKQSYLRDKLKSRYISYKWHDPELSLLEAVFARGDRRLGKVLVSAWENGCRFDAWDEDFKYDRWMDAFRKHGLEPSFYANRRRSAEEVFPWEHIDMGISKEFLLNEKNKAYRAERTPDCRTQCSGCGASVFGGGVCL